MTYLISTSFLILLICNGIKIGMGGEKIVGSNSLSTCGRNVRRISSPNCSVTSQSILGGDRASIQSWPWMLSIIHGSCGASLINPKYAITAAHCLHGLQTKRIRVCGGSKYDYETAVSQCTWTNNYMMHPKYNYGNDINDIAILELETPFNISTNIRPICLPHAKEILSEGQDCYVAGWGYTNNEKLDNEHRLREVCLPILKKKTCQAALRRFGYIAPTTICAGYKYGSRKDTCNGNSGGPLMCYSDGQTWKLNGIVSWGPGCSVNGDIGVYTETRRFLNWIKKHTGI